MVPLTSRDAHGSGPGDGDVASAGAPAHEPGGEAPDSEPSVASGVPFRSPLLALLDALDAAADAREAPAHVRAFVAWVAGDEGAGELGTLAAQAGGLTGAARTYRDVAVLGFAAAAPGGATPDASCAAALEDGLGWLAGREWFAPGRPQTFEVDAVALLGVALAAARPGEAAGRPGRSGSPASGGTPAGGGRGPRTWLDEVLARSAAALTDPWERGIVEAARHVLAPDDEATVRRVVEAAPDLAVALAAQGALPAAPDADAAAFALVADLSFRAYGPDRAAAQRAALRRLTRDLAVALPGRATVSDVVALLRGVERAMRRWTWEEKPSTRGAAVVRWPVVNEYHVQNLLWAILSPVFPDLEDEENINYIVLKHPR